MYWYRDSNPEFLTTINHASDIWVVLIRIYNETLWTFKIMMWAFAPYNTIQTNKYRVDLWESRMVARRWWQPQRPQRCGHQARGSKGRRYSTADWREGHSPVTPLVLPLAPRHLSAAVVSAPCAHSNIPTQPLRYGWKLHIRVRVWRLSPSAHWLESRIRSRIMVI